MLTKKSQIEIPQIQESEKNHGLSYFLLKLLLLCFALAFASELLILSASEIAERLSVPQSIIAVTVVALGTSIPELVTSIIAVRRGLGEIALGNIIGADILNVLLVAGSAAALTPGGLSVDPIFFSRNFPVMLLVLIVLRCGIIFSKENLHKAVGGVLLFIYFYLTYLNISEIS